MYNIGGGGGRGGAPTRFVFKPIAHQWFKVIFLC